MHTAKTDQTGQISRFESLLSTHVMMLVLSCSRSVMPFLTEAEISRMRIILLHMATLNDYKKVSRKVQGMPQSQTVANPLHQEKEKKDKNIHAP